MKINVHFFLKLILSSLLIYLYSSIFICSVFSDETNEFSITIIKYKLSDNQLKNQNFPNTPTDTYFPYNILNESSDEKIELMAGVQYLIQPITPSKTENKFEDLSESPHLITTNHEGEATISLLEGYYRVSEIKNEQIAQPAAPIIIQLPLKLQNGKIINNVYIYPKSSIVKKTPSTSNPNKDSFQEKKLPETSTNIEMKLEILYICLGIVISLGGVGLFLLKK